MKKTLAVFLFFLALIFIWAQSTLGPMASGAESDFVMSIVRPFFELFAGKGNVTQTMVRKTAHYTEYALLGVFAFFFLYKEGKRTGKQVVQCFMLCLFVSFIDESIQLFTGRGPAIMDMWIDMSGVLIGTVAGLLVEKKLWMKN